MRERTEVPATEDTEKFAYFFRVRRALLCDLCVQSLSLPGRYRRVPSIRPVGPGSRMRRTSWKPASPSHAAYSSSL